jgi:hypothetical protein
MTASFHKVERLRPIHDSLISQVEEEYYLGIRELE